MRMVGRGLAGIAGQLGNPHGWAGPVVAAVLNRGNRYLIEAAVDAAQVRRGQTVADIGFGGGAGLGLLLERAGANGTVHGIEISRDMLSRAGYRYRRFLEAGRLRLEPGSLTELPLSTASVDAAITVNTVYFLAELERACAELRRVLRPGGRVVVGVGEPEAMARMPFARYGIRLRPVAEVIGALERTGLVVEHGVIERWPIDGHFLVGR
ncbi:class I SAM-dependent methyltransferase [Nocardia sp. NPDC101769]|uniref:class I SAM-dependent methyltransferase n=1 Tax=Nocardia sp. NPDC101769 TaxID=3364333 RepID=UPI0038083905